MTNNKNSNLKWSAIEVDILTVLLGREMYGLEILDRLNFGRPNELRFSSLYPALNRLEKKGFVSWQWGDLYDKSGGARRKYYKVKPEGANALRLIQLYRTSLASRQSEKALNDLTILPKVDELIFA